MKVPPKRKGNLRWLVRACSANLTLNESPSKKEGKYSSHPAVGGSLETLNESPSEKEGKFATESPAGRFPDEPQ